MTHPDILPTSARSVVSPPPAHHTHIPLLFIAVLGAFEQVLCSYLILIESDSFCLTEGLS